MKREEYLKEISNELGYSQKEIDQIINAYLNRISSKIVSNDKVTITNLGTFQKTLIKPKVIFSPIDGSELNAKSYYRLTFTCSKQLLEKLKK